MIWLRNIYKEQLDYGQRYITKVETVQYQHHEPSGFLAKITGSQPSQTQNFSIEGNKREWWLLSPIRPTKVTK